jgi:Fe-S-cluster containining protein
VRQSIEPRTDAVIKIWRKASERDRTMIGEMHQHYEREVRRIVDEGNEPQNVAHTIHTLIDPDVSRTLTETANGRKVKCREGCAHCCSLQVNITHEEAVLLVGYCEDEGIAVDWDKLRRQASHNFKQWDSQSARERRCVFLGTDSRCTVYEHRPAACRKYMVLSAPALCDTVRHPGAQVAVVVAIEAEVIVSAMLGVLDNGSMPRMLLQAERNDA